MMWMIERGDAKAHRLWNVRRFLLSETATYNRESIR